MIPGEYFLEEGDIEANGGRATAQVTVANTGDRPIQVGSHYHFFEANKALAFDRGRAWGMRLDIPAGTAVRFEPGLPRTVDLPNRVNLYGPRDLGAYERQSAFDCDVIADLIFCSAFE